MAVIVEDLEDVDEHKRNSPEIIAKRNTRSGSSRQLIEASIRPWTSTGEKTKSRRRRNDLSAEEGRPKTSLARRERPNFADTPNSSWASRTNELPANVNSRVTRASYISSSALSRQPTPATVSWSGTDRSAESARSRRTISESGLITDSWALTEVQLHQTPQSEKREILAAVSSSEDEAPPAEDAAPFVDLKTYEETPKWRRKNLPWTGGLDGNSDDYDTDLEEDFPPEPEPPSDPTGRFLYEEKCRKNGIVPASFLIRNLGEGNLRMRSHYLGGRATKPLACALKENTVVEEVDLTDNYIEGQGASALAKMLRDNMFIVNLNVSNNFIKSEGAEAFAQMLQENTTLKTLNLQGNKLTDKDAKRIGEALKNNMSLSCINLSHNGFGEQGGLYLATGIGSNIGLCDVDLSWNHIREKGAVAISKAILKNSSLEILDLSWNGLAYNGTVALSQALRVNKSLKVLDIRQRFTLDTYPEYDARFASPVKFCNNRLNTDAAKKLSAGIARNKGLETLLIGMNPIGEEGVDALLKAVNKNPTLKLIGVEGCMDLSTSTHIQQCIGELEASRDIMIMCTAGSPQQSNVNGMVIAVFDRFLTENADRLDDLFNQMDKDKSGDVTLEELKYGLKDFGLRLTSKQLDMLLDELDADKSGTIEYDELMKGSAMIRKEKEKMERLAKGSDLIRDAPDGNAR